MNLHALYLTLKQTNEHFFKLKTFARRALSKINELYELELASINAEEGIKSPQFREATIKVRYCGIIFIIIIQ